MFAKMLKYDLRATGGTCGILSAAALGLTALVTVLFRAVPVDDNLYLDMILGLMAAFFVLAMLAYVAAVEILQFVRFYKSRFTDEGYLTFTLPVNSHQIFLSGFVTVLLWTVLSILVFALCIGTFTLVGCDAIEPISEALDLLLYIDIGESFGIYALQLGVSAIYSIIICLTSLTIGAVIAKKHKVLMAFGIYYGISVANSILSSLISTALILNVEEISDNVLQRSACLSIAWSLILMIVGYGISTGLMKRKLNLP